MLSKEELTFITNQRNFELKNEVDQVINHLLYHFQQELANSLEKHVFRLPLKLSKLPGKVNKGNNHKGFPFQVIDYPSVLNKTDQFSFRSLVWYGNLFSFSLILNGKPKSNYHFPLEGILNKGYQLLLSNEIWETDVNHQSHMEISTNNLKEVNTYISENHMIKIFKTFDLNQIHDFERLGIECFRDFFS